MNMFVQNAPGEVAAKVAEDLTAFLVTARCNATIETTESGITVRKPTGATLDIYCDGPDAFRLEDDKDARGGMTMVRAQMRRWNGQHRIDQGQMAASVAGWLQSS